MLSKLLNEFKDVTVQLNNSLEEDKLELIEELLNKRQSVIEEINLLNYSKEEFKNIADKLKLEEEEKRLGNFLKTKLLETKKDIENNKKEMSRVSRQRNVNKMYVNVNPLDPVFLSKKY